LHVAGAATSPPSERLWRGKILKKIIKKKWRKTPKKWRKGSWTSSNLNKIGNILAKATALRINLNIDDAPITSRAHTHPSPVLYLREISVEE
jgi:hypothetical protein